VEAGKRQSPELELHRGGCRAKKLEPTRPELACGAGLVQAGEEAGRGGGGGGGDAWFELLGLPAAAADGDVTEGAAFGPVAAAGLAEVAGLAQAVVVVVAELCVGRVAPRALEGLLLVGLAPLGWCFPVACGDGLHLRRRRWGDVLR